MAHILVYVQRSPRGLHPASGLALCVARDIGSTRGASVVGICPGDGGAFDDHVVAAAGKAGADQVVFVGPHGLNTLAHRLRPKHVLTPWTHEAAQAVQEAGLETANPAWVGGPVADVSVFSRVVAVVAGTLPWHNMPGPIEAEFEGQVDQASVPAWVSATTTAQRPGADVFFVGPSDLDPALKGALEALGARAVTPDYAGQHRTGTLLWLDAGPTGLPAVLADRPAEAVVIALPGTFTEIHQSWSLADWVIPGPWDQAAKQLSAEHWKAALM